MLWHAYVDESGDRGWKDRPPNLPAGKRVGSSRIFSATAVLIPDGSQNAALAAWDQTAVTVGKSPGAHIHFHDVNSTGQRKYLAQTVAQVPGIKIISVVLCKFHLPNVVAIKQPGHLAWVPQNVGIFGGFATRLCWSQGLQGCPEAPNA